MRASYGELKEEIHQMKRRVAALERAFDAIATRDDLKADEDAQEDLRRGWTASLAETKKKALEA